MKLTIESMTYGADGLAHADNGKAVFVQGAVAGDTVEAEIVQDGKSFMRARATEILEPSPAVYSFTRAKVGDVMTSSTLSRPQPRSTHFPFPTLF